MLQQEAEIINKLGLHARASAKLTQLAGQFKSAVRAAESAGTLGLLLNKLFQRTFSVAKVVRSETDIGASTVSMASAAVKLAERIYPTIADQSVLFIGAGEMIELCATHFSAQHPKHATFANRTLERAQALAERFPRKVAVRLEFSNPLAHRIEAGADLFLMPSHFEPCGLNQM